VFVTAAYLSKKDWFLSIYVIQNLVEKEILISFHVSNNNYAKRFWDYSSNDFDGIVKNGLRAYYFVTAAWVRLALTVRSLLRGRDFCFGDEAMETRGAEGFDWCGGDEQWKKKSGWWLERRWKVRFKFFFTKQIIKYTNVIVQPLISTVAFYCAT
jgi:hypothetical protein